jgi:hypothetical protein
MKASLLRCESVCAPANGNVFDSQPVRPAEGKWPAVNSSDRNLDCHRATFWIKLSGDVVMRQLRLVFGNDCAGQTQENSERDLKGADH